MSITFDEGEPVRGMIRVIAPRRRHGWITRRFRDGTVEVRLLGGGTTRLPRHLLTFLPPPVELDDALRVVKA